jgi:hypothetical protein
MNAGIGNAAVQFHFWEYKNLIFGTVNVNKCLLCVDLKRVRAMVGEVHIRSAIARVKPAPAT